MTIHMRTHAHAGGSGSQAHAPSHNTPCSAKCCLKTEVVVMVMPNVAAAIHLQTAELEPSAGLHGLYIAFLSYLFTVTSLSYHIWSRVHLPLSNQSSSVVPVWWACCE